MDRESAEHADRHVGERIRKRRIELGLDQAQLAELLNVTLDRAAEYEAGEKRMSEGCLSDIAQRLGVDVGYFYEGYEGQDRG